MTIEEFFKDYEYVSDEKQFGYADVWEICKRDNDGKFRGDCETVILSLKHYVPECKNLQMYYCEVNGNGHAIGKLNDQWIDCNIKEFVDELPERYTNISKFWKIEIWLRMMSTKLFGRVIWVW